MFPDGIVSSSGMHSSRTTYTAPTSSATVRGFIVNPHVDSIVAMAAATWSGTWSEVADHVENSQVEALCDAVRPVAMYVKITSLVPADGVPLMINYGQIPGGTLSTALSSSDLTLAARDIAGRQLEAVSLSPGDSHVFTWVPKVRTDEAFYGSTTTTTLGDTYSNSLPPYSKLLFHVAGIAPSEPYIRLDIMSVSELTVHPSYGGWLAQTANYEDPRLLAAIRGLRKVMSVFSGATDFDEALLLADQVSTQLSKALASGAQSDMREVIEGVVAYCRLVLRLARFITTFT